VSETFDQKATRVAQEYIQFDKMIDALKQADDAARMIGYYRSDPKWIMVAGKIHDMREKLIRLGRQVSH
jgi:hypothetical protein